MVPFPKNITVKRGDTKSIFIRVRTQTWNSGTNSWDPGPYRDLTGWTVLSQIRESNDAAEVLATFTPTLTDQVATPGGIYLRLAPAVTAALTVVSGVWDCQLTDLAGDVYTYVEGTYTLAKDVSRTP